MFICKKSAGTLKKGVRDMSTGSVMQLPHVVPYFALSSSLNFKGLTSNWPPSKHPTLIGFRLAIRDVNTVKINPEQQVFDDMLCFRP
ncbi:hypothetical protein TNCV_256521 [Trichonephila clavipes]|nr:hypothetical protein TNCV_256521 [Trichonephila clavipes]